MTPPGAPSRAMTRPAVITEILFRLDESERTARAWEPTYAYVLRDYIRMLERTLQEEEEER